jgi:PAS domain S-box-containing protein
VELRRDLAPHGQESREAEESHARQLRLFDGVASTTPDFVYVFDLEGRFQYANQRLLEVWGMRLDDVVGKTCRELGYEQWHHDMHMREIAQVIATKRAIKGEVPFRAPLTGIFGVYEYIFTPVLAPDGAVEAIAGTTRDVTERKRGEDERRRSEEQARRAERQLSMALRAARAGVFDWSVKPNVSHWSDELLALYGLTRDGFGGRYEDWVASLLPEDRDAAVAAVQAALKSGVLDLEFRIRRADTGEVRWLHGRAEVTFDPAGAPDRMVGINVDITDRKHAQAVAAAGEQRFRTVIDAAPAGLTLLRAIRGANGAIEDFEWLYVNRAACTAIDRPLTELLGARLGEVLPGAWTSSDLFEVFCRSLETRSIQSVESAAHTPGGAGTFLNVAAPYEGDELLVWFVDISERKQMEARLQEADRRKDEFLATLSHELRNPLAPIRSAAKLLADPRLEGHQLAWAQDIIQRQVAHMAWLLDDLLDVARITQHKLELKPQRASLVSVVDAAVEAARPLLDSKRHRLRVTLPDDLKWIHADPTRLSQVLSNLVTNAAKYTDPGGRIELKAEVDDTSLCFSVTDDGIGIEPEALPKLFEMFSQLEGTQQRSEGGLGIGLALVKGLVELHGGGVEAFSDGPGLGSTFRVRIPRNPGAVELEEPVAGPDNASAEPVRVRVLVADDNEDAADTLGMLIKLAGHEVRVVHGGQTALSVAQTFRPDVALIDVGMPDLSGYDVARAIRRDGWGESMRLVAVTGWGQQEDRHLAHEAGFDDHLTKPVDPDKVLAVVGASGAPPR